MNSIFLLAGAAFGPGCPGLRFAAVLRTRPGQLLDDTRSYSDTPATAPAGPSHP